MENYLSEEQAANFLGFSLSSIRKWRKEGVGPVYLKFESGSIRYTKSDLEKYVESRKVESNQSK